VWPFLTTGSPLSWDPDAGAATNLRHYLTYYAATSFGWDTFRAVGNAALVIALGRPLLRSLDRAARRMRLDVRTDGVEPMAVDPATPQTSRVAPREDDDASVASR
jgi:energy-coupling factor transport system substrate-specific component